MCPLISSVGVGGDAIVVYVLSEWHDTYSSDRAHLSPEVFMSMRPLILSMVLVITTPPKDTHMLSRY